MLDPPKCYIRQCKHLGGVKYLGQDLGEETEVIFCDAFPEGIPEDIAYGGNKHKKPTPDQGNDIVYERG